MPDDPKTGRLGRERMALPVAWWKRRRFCQWLGAAACATASAGAGLLSVDYIDPRVLFEPPTRFTLEPPEAVAVGSVLVDESHHVYVLRSSQGFWALSSVCTHLGCITRYRPEERIIACPCHGSRFSLDGEVTAGPAPRPLRWLQMDLSPKGEITVDTAAEIPLGTVIKL
ncbi:MAG: ubiquinol-cytochrome c reductase iron-sulfur subunit [Acidobacteriota bacterium]